MQARGLFDYDVDKVNDISTVNGMLLWNANNKKVAQCILHHSEKLSEIMLPLPNVISDT